MFERYTEKARRIIFFARYEASQFGSPYIETEHLLLGLLREDKALTRRFLGSPGALESIRAEIEKHTFVREKIHTSVDLPLSNESKRVLAYAAEEAERLSHQHIGSEHLFLGLVREEKSFAAKLLHDRGIRLEKVREELGRFPHDQASQQGQRQQSPFAQFSRDFAHSVNPLQPLVGRENELERLIHVLCRLTRRSPVLVGGHGVGKKTIIGGLAQRIADGTVPATLAGKSILTLDLSVVAGFQRDRAWPGNFLTAVTAEGAIFFVDELHTPTGMPSRDIHVEEILKRLLMTSRIQCISTATPSGYARSIENHGWLQQYFQPIDVHPAPEADTVSVLQSIKGEYETFHGVSYSDEAIAHAVSCAHRFITERELPGQAVDLIDEVGASIGLTHKLLPQEVIELQKRIKFIVHRMQGAIANHEFEKARFYSDEEAKEREHLRELREKYKLGDTLAIPVTIDHIETVVARMTGMSTTTIRQGLADSKKPHP